MSINILQNNTSTKVWIGLLGMGLSSFIGCIDLTSVNTMLPSIQVHLNVPIIKLQWIINVFMIALATCMVIVGQLADMFGRRKILYIGIVLLAISSVAAGCSVNINMLIFFRLFQGIAVSILYTVPVALVANLFPAHLRSRAIGILVSINAIGLAIGPLIGGVIVSMFDWRWVFFFNVPLLLISIIICMLTLPAGKINNGHSNKIDFKGLILLIIGIPMIIQALASQSHNPLYYIIPLIVLALFVLAERKAPCPIINLSFFSKRNFTFGITANFFLAFFYTAALFLIPLYLHIVMKLNYYIIGILLLPITGTMAILSPFVDRAIKKFGLKIIFAIGFICFTIFSTVQTTFDQQTLIVSIIFTSILFGIGWACILTPSIISTVFSVAENSGGAAMGSLGTLHNIGGALGLAICLGIYNNFSAHHIANQNISVLLPSSFIVGYHATMWFLSGFCFLGIFLVSLGIKNDAGQISDC